MQIKPSRVAINRQFGIFMTLQSQQTVKQSLTYNVNGEEQKTNLKNQTHMATTRGPGPGSEKVTFQRNSVKYVNKTINLNA